MRKLLKGLLIVASFMLSSAFTFPKYRDDIFIKDDVSKTMDNLQREIGLTEYSWKENSSSEEPRYELADGFIKVWVSEDNESILKRVNIGKMNEKSFINLCDILGVGITPMMSSLIDNDIDTGTISDQIITDDYVLTVTNVYPIAEEYSLIATIDFDEESISQTVDKQLSLAKGRDAAEELSITQLYKDYPKEWVDAYLQSAISTKGDFIKWFNVELNAYPKEKRSEEIERMLKKNYETQSIIDSQFE